MNQYDIDIDKLEVSKEVTDQKEILKYKLARYISDEIKNIGAKKTIELTSLNKSDISKLKIGEV